jgi:peptidoglycan/LPS O-acetylase OafA/YrhL
MQVSFSDAECGFKMQFALTWPENSFPVSRTLFTSGLFVASRTLNSMAGSIRVIYTSLIMIPGFLALIAEASRDLSGSRTVLGSKSLVRLSQWSFALHLVHELVIRIRPFLTEMSAAETFGAAILAINAAITLSGLLHEFVEKPAEKWLRSRGDSGCANGNGHWGTPPREIGN